ncbi:MAG TPA: hypothetical protein VMU66_00680, partial [Gaiellales bacterium]|nr:hypothetical protein [Gaiellales bacterium]
MLDDRGVYGVVGLDRPTTMLEVLETARDVSAADTSFVWGSEQMIHGLGEEAARWFPMWGPHMPSHHTYDA